MNNKNKKILAIIITGIVSVSLLIAGIFVMSNEQPVTLNKMDIEPTKLNFTPEISLTPADNEEIGVLYFPKVDLRVPIVYGYNADFMDKYFDVVGLEAWGNFPGQKNKLYINGHRHLAFQNLKHMELGDKVILEMPYGNFTYEVNHEPQVVRSNDKDAIAFYREGHDEEFSPQIMRLQTCYPFEAGSTLDHRYLVDLVLIESEFFE